MAGSRWRALARSLGALVLFAGGLGMAIAVAVMVVVHGPAARLALLPVFIIAGFALDYAALRVLMAPGRRRARIAQAEGGNPPRS